MEDGFDEGEHLVIKSRQTTNDNNNEFVTTLKVAEEHD